MSGGFTYEIQAARQMREIPHHRPDENTHIPETIS
jgi:hypothetical protein